MGTEEKKHLQIIEFARFVLFFSFFFFISRQCYVYAAVMKRNHKTISHRSLGYYSRDITFSTFSRWSRWIGLTDSGSSWQFFIRGWNFRTKLHNAAKSLMMRDQFLLLFKNRKALRVIIFEKSWRYETAKIACWSFRLEMRYRAVETENARLSRSLKRVTLSWRFPDNIVG